MSPHLRGEKKNRSPNLKLHHFYFFTLMFVYMFVSCKWVDPLMMLLGLFRTEMESHFVTVQPSRPSVVRIISTWSCEAMPRPRKNTTNGNPDAASRKSCKSSSFQKLLYTNSIIGGDTPLVEAEDGHGPAVHISLVAQANAAHSCAVMPFPRSTMVMAAW